MAAILSHTHNVARQYHINEDEILTTKDTVRDIQNKGFDIATYYIPYKLRQTVPHEKLRGLPTHYLIPPQQPSDLQLSVAYHCMKMESQHSSFFDDVPTTLRLQTNNAEELFMQICEQVFSDGNKNWGRVVTIFALAATFAVHFANSGSLDIISRIPTWVSRFIGEFLSEWIREQGGWVRKTIF